MAMMIAITSMTFATDEKAARMESITGEALSVDPEGGKIVIISDEKESTLKARPKMLEGIAAGESVKIEKADDEVKTIKQID